MGGQYVDDLTGGEVEVKSVGTTLSGNLNQFYSYIITTRFFKRCNYALLGVCMC